LTPKHPLTPQDTPAPPTAREGLLPAALILLLTAALSLVWSHAKLMWNDEFLSLYGDALPTLRQVWQVQLHTPISLDPPTYHLLSHLSLQVLGRHGMALRLPALAGFLLLQSSLFLLVRQLAGVRAALIAMALPLCTASFRYSVEGRPYGLLLGLYALSLLCWYTAAARYDHGPLDQVHNNLRTESSRIFPLLGLVCAIALAITSHFFGLLILIPVSLGELTRTIHRRRFDWPMVAALVMGTASIALILPFQKALLPYRQHYYINSVNIHKVSQGYRELFVRYNTWPMPMQRVCAIALCIATLLLAFAAFRRFRNHPKSDPAYLWAALLSFAALPFFGYLFGKFVTHTMEVRYVIAALVAFAVVIALLLQPRLQSKRFFLGSLSAILLFGTVSSAYQIVLEQRRREITLAEFIVPPELKSELVANPRERLYTQDLEGFFLGRYFTPDPLVRSRLSLIYDEPSELRWLHHNTNAVTAVYMQQFTGLSVTPYRDFLAQPHPLLLDSGTGWDWIRKDLRAQQIGMQYLGSALHGKLVRVDTGAPDPDGDKHHGH